MVALAGSDDVGELAFNALTIYLDIPNSFGEFLFQHLVGAFVATMLWFMGMARHLGR